MLIAAAGYLSGYDGRFEFKEPGIEYDDVEYVGMRQVQAHLGINLALRFMENCSVIAHVTCSPYSLIFLQLCAVFGALCVPLAFLTVREAVPHRFNAALLAGVLVLCGMFYFLPIRRALCRCPAQQSLRPFHHHHRVILADHLAVHPLGPDTSVFHSRGHLL